MPVFCSSNSQIIILGSITVMLLYTLAYLTGQSIPNSYDGPGMFNPNSQDYFRTILLGLCSPFVYYFIRAFILNVNQRYLVLNLILDYPLNDWFIFCILVTLAYPQIQDSTSNISSINQAYWQIIPKQSYIFGISWSLGEFTLSIVDNLFKFKEVKRDSLSANEMSHNNNNINTSSNNNNNNNNNIHHRPHHLPNRKNITLSKCVDIRKQASNISNNVYSSSHGEEHHQANGYGSINAESSNVAPSSSLSHSTSQNDSILLINDTDNSLKFASGNVEDRLLDTQEQPGVDYGLHSGEPTSGTIQIRYFNEIGTSRTLLIYLFQLSVCILGNTSLLVGECLLMSIYFIYIPGNEDLFSKVINYFGLKPISHFLLIMVLPFTIINFVMNFVIFFWKDLDDWFDTRGTAQEENVHPDDDINNLLNSEPWLPLHNHQEIPQLHNNNYYPGSSNPYDIGFNGVSDYNRVYEMQTPGGKLLRWAKKITQVWQIVCSKDKPVLTFMFIWGLIVYGTGIYTVFYI